MSSSLKSLKIKAKLFQKAKMNSGQLITLKAAQNKIAKLSGFTSWQDLKKSVDEADLFCPKGSSAIWKVWYNTYAEANLHFDPQNHFLLPYRKQYFICDSNSIEFLGISLKDPDLVSVGADWVHPKDALAWDRLLTKIKKPQR